MRPFIAFFILFAFSSSLSAQTKADRPVTVTGIVINAKPVIYNRRIRNMDFPSVDELVAFDVTVYLQFRNETNQRLIIFNPTGFLGKKRVTLHFHMTETEQHLLMSIKSKNYRAQV